MMLVSLRLNVPRYFIQRWSGAAELGVFAALASLLVAGNLIITALGQAATPRLAALYHAGSLGAFRALVRQLLLVALALGAAGLLAAAAAGGPLLGLLFGVRYANRTGLLLLLMAVGPASYASSVLGFALTSARTFTAQLPVFAATTLACAAGCLWLVPRQGVEGATLAWGASMLLEVGAVAVLLSRALRRRAERGNP
jgi:O-antigen/teichoic acid export membrane protein